MATNVDPLAKANRETLSDSKRKLLEQRLRQKRNRAVSAQQIPPRDPGTSIPIAPEQRSIWLHSHNSSEQPVYNEALTIHRRGSFDRAVMQATLSEIIRRHEAWRTSFHEVGDEVVQIVHEASAVPLPLIDLSSVPAEAREAEAIRLATLDAALPIPLEGPTLIRARVLRLDDDNHRLHLTMHHIIFDGVSIYRILMPELAAIYSAFAAGQPSPLPELPLQYGDFALWRRAMAATPEALQQLRFWKERLSGNLPVLTLPVDRLRKREISHRGAMECFSLPAELIEHLRSLGRSQGATLYMVLLAAFKVLLFRYSGQEDLIVGGTTDTRRRAELEGLMGHFLSTFAIRTQPSAETTFSSFLAEVKNALLEALSAVDVSWDQIVQTVQPQRDSTRHPIFQVFFSMEPPVEPFAEGWDLTQMDVNVGAAKFDLYLELDERPDGMAARILYSTDLFDPSTIRRMIGHWKVLLNAIHKAPHAVLGQLPLLTEEELWQLNGVGGWNDTAVPIPDLPVHAMVAARAAETPHAVAAAAGETQCTYAELIHRATGIAAALQAAGAVHGSIVAVLLHRSLDLIAGLLGTLMAGAAYLPLDPHVPEARLAWSLDDAQPTVILTESSLIDVLPPHAASLLLVEEVPNTQTSPAFQPAAVGAEDTAYIIHTSGTTGRPKAVEIRHGSLMNTLASMQMQPGFAASDTLLAVTTISFDIAALELFLPLIAGGRVIITTREAAQDPYQLAAAIDGSGCTVLQATPSTWRSLLTSGWRPGSPLRALCGGEALPRDLAQQLLAVGAELWNVYGPTETTIWSTVHRVEHGVEAVPIGRVIGNTTAYILDRQHQMLPVGVAGELWLGGAGLAKGYRGQPELTADRFLEVEAAGGARLYRTGDLAVRYPNGDLVCLGRTDQQVKVRGFRVELGAVEAAVCEHPQVSAAAARVWPEISGGSRLTVYVVGREHGAPTAAELRRFLSAFVPDFMIPSDVVRLQTMPLTHNGKVDRNTLPPPGNRESDNAIATPSSDYEQRLCALWQDLLHLNSVGVVDNFFDLGGHSLLIATLQQRIHASFGHRVAMAALFQAPTVQGQALLLQMIDSRRAATPGLLPLQPLGSRPAIFWLHPPPLIGNLATALGTDQPLFGVMLTDDDLVSFKDSATISGIAARHVNTIRAVQPHGPYYLAGLCTGGIVAFETALQLQAAGEEVAQLILVDAQNPVFFRRLDSLAVELNKTKFYLMQMQHGRRNGTQATLRQRLFYRARQMVVPSVARPETLPGSRLTDAAAYKYRPSIFRGDVLLLQPKHRPSRVDHVAGWQTVVDGTLIACDVQGHHDELLTMQNVTSTATAIAKQLTLTLNAGSNSTPMGKEDVVSTPSAFS